MTNTGSSVPGTERLGPLIAACDTAADDALNRLRGTPVLDRIMTAASHAGDWSLIWHTISAVRALAVGRPDQAIRMATLLGAESLIVNQGIKRLVRRERPTIDGDPSLRVRQPSTSAFPSGHASAATVAALALGTVSPRLRPLWWTLAALVGASRAYVRIHHTSDVVGGAITGAVLWRLIGRTILGGSATR